MNLRRMLRAPAPPPPDSSPPNLPEPPPLPRRVRTEVPPATHAVPKAGVSAPAASPADTPGDASVAPATEPTTLPAETSEVPSDTPAAPMAEDLLSRFERTRVGRVLVLVVILVVGSILVVDNLPASQLKRSLTPVVKPVESNLGLRQNWALFAPNPPRKQSVLFAQIEYSDGSVGSWQLPGWGGATGSYQGYRWRKWGESLMRSKRQAQLESAGRSIATFAARDGLEVTRVVLWRITKQVGDGLDKTIGRYRLISVDVQEAS